MISHFMVWYCALNMEEISIEEVRWMSSLTILARNSWQKGRCWGTLFYSSLPSNCWMTTFTLGSSIDIFSKKMFLFSGGEVVVLRGKPKLIRQVNNLFSSLFEGSVARELYLSFLKGVYHENVISKYILYKIHFDGLSILCLRFVYFCLVEIFELNSLFMRNFVLVTIWIIFASLFLSLSLCK